MKTSLRVNILASFTTLIVLSTLLLLTNFYFQSSEAARALSEKIGAEMSDKVIGQIQAYLSPAINGTMLTAKRIQREEIGKIDEEGLWRSMWDMLMNAPQLESLYVATADGRFWQSRRKPEWTTRFLRVGSGETLERWFLRDEDYRLKSVEDKKTTYDPRQRPWYLSTTAAMKVNWSDIYIFKTVKRPGLTATFPVLRDGKLTAVVAADISLASISEFLARQSVSEHGFILIVDERNEVVAFGDQEKTVQATADGKGLRTSRVSDLGLGWLEQALDARQKSGNHRSVIKAGADNFIVSTTMLPEGYGNGWKVVVALPESDVLQRVNRTMKQSLAISLVILAAAIIFVLLLARHISIPLVQLARETGKIKDFDLEGIHGVNSRIHEVAMMSDAVLSMRSGLQAFRQYVPADLVRQLIASGNEALPGGKEVEITLFFSDIANFTSITETLPARELMIDVSEYFEVMTEPISRQRGTVDKFIGDAVMAFWGAPIANEQHAVSACRAALQSQEAIQQLNERRLAMGNPAFYTRIGIHTGFTIVGNMGSRDRLNYTALGDNVNLASRLEGVNKAYGTRIIISQDTYRYVRKEFILRPLDLVAVKGKTASVLIYELMGELEGDAAPALCKLASSFQEIYELYLDRQWEKALALLRELHAEFPEDRPTRMYMERCQNLLDQDPGSEWSGVVRMSK